MVSSEWAVRQRERLATSSPQPEPWLAGTVDIRGHALVRWHLLLAAFCALGAGPKSLGYGLLALALHSCYTELYLKGRTPARLWASLQREAATQNAQVVAKQRGRKKRRK